jgi:penicillin-binding protein
MCAFLWLTLLLGTVATGYVAALVHEEEIRSRTLIRTMVSQSSETGFVYFQDGSVAGQLRTEEDRRRITYRDIPPLIEQAVLATEDDRFYAHRGVDIASLARAIRQRLLNEDVQTGGSTITQQLARRVFLSLEKSDARKIKEIFLALRIERFMTKQEIMAAYLNKIPYGNGATGYNLYGIKAAARGIFNKDLTALHLAQIAYLTGLPQQPTTFSAFTSKGTFNATGFAAAKQRQTIVLDRMHAEGHITAAQHKEALSFDIQGSLASPSRKDYAIYPFLMLEAERQAAEILLRTTDPTLTEAQLRDQENAPRLADARELLLRGGYKIYTSIDRQVYDIMTAIAQNNQNFSKDSPRKGMEQIGAVLLDNATGAIRGMIEGRDFSKEQLNHATQMLRQPGSAMKPIAAYLPALNGGLIQPASILDDVPLVLPDRQKGVHIPQNWDKKFHGLVTARQALNQSWNIPALRLFLDTVTVKKAWDFTRSLGITSITRADEQASTGVIGGLKYGVSVEELTNAYAAIPNKGMFVDAYFVQKITDAQGNVLYAHKVNPQRVFSPQASFLMTDMLRTVVTAGTGAEVQRQFQHKKKVTIAGKTGTTSDNYDLWFVGFSPDVTLGVWIGYDQPSSLPAASRAKRVWTTIMNDLYKKKPSLFPTQAFPMPSDIVQKTVSAVSGLLPTPLVLKENKTVTDYFQRQYIPTKLDNVLQEEKIVEIDGNVYRANPLTPVEFTKLRVTIKRDPPLQDLIAKIEKAWSKQKKPAPNSSTSFNKERFMPQDGYAEMPTESDPRLDDGENPTPPLRVSLQQNGNNLTLSFTANVQKDIVGYRVFRATGDNAYAPLTDRVIFQTSTPQFTDTISSTAQSYYVVAVDVVGRTSPPSEPVTTREGAAQSVENTLEWQQDRTENPPDQVQPNTDEQPPSDTTPRPSTNPPNENATVPPTAPQLLKVSKSEFGVELMWKPHADDEIVERYDIYYAAAEDGEQELIGSTFEPAFLYSSAMTTGWYTVRAVNEYGESAPSKTVSFKE